MNDSFLQSARTVFWYPKCYFYFEFNKWGKVFIIMWNRDSKFGNKIRRCLFLQFVARDLFDLKCVLFHRKYYVCFSKLENILHNFRWQAIFYHRNLSKTFFINFLGKWMKNYLYNLFLKWQSIVFVNYSQCPFMYKIYFFILFVAMVHSYIRTIGQY